MLILAIICISKAFLLYTISIWSARIVNTLKPWMIKIFIAAFVCDLIGTSLMFFQTTAKFQLSFHSTCGYATLGIMGLHLIIAIAALKKYGRAEEYFHRFSLVAWFVWLIAFFSGVPRM